jgi:ubiquinone/menaquinone biosynthesis C-methylase UbiE
MDDFKKPFIDFYNRYNIIPVAQDISDIEMHFQRRSALYRHCGIPSLLVRDRTVLEIGPGTGHNALYTNSLGPAEYVLVDGAKQSIRQLESLFNHFFEDISNCEIIESPLEKLDLDKKFDIVLCEGAIPFQKNPCEFLRIVADFAGPSGIVLITCADSVSYFSEILRRIMGHLMLALNPSDTDLSKELEVLRPVFSGHLGNLKGMSRPVDDWICDNILQPFLGVPMSIADAIHALENDFYVYGSSPNIFTDWRWYKDIHGENRKFNEAGLEVFWRNVHNLMDYRHVFEPCRPEQGMKTMQLCSSIFDLSIQIQNSGPEISCLEKVCEQLAQIREIFSGFSPDTASAMEEFELMIKKFISGRNPDFSNMPAFAPWFGRGQQYLSFIRKD